MKSHLKIVFAASLLIAICCSCGKGYEVRIMNYNVEDMDSVLVGNKLVFENVPRLTSTEYKKLEKGTYTVTFITKTKQHLGSSITIPKRKSGKRTIQIDGQGTIAVLQD